MEVQFRPLGCLDYLGCVLSLGFLPLFLWFYRRQLPARLTEEAMVLRSGKEIPWSQFTRAKATKFYYGNAFIGTRYELWHPTGKVEIGTDKVQNAQAVEQFVLSHLPRSAVDSGTDVTLPTP
jgi:hypothetical protein